MVSEVEVMNEAVAALPYCFRSSRNLLLLTNTITDLPTLCCPLNLFAQLAANDATEALSESRSDTISPKLRLVQMV